MYATPSQGSRAWHRIDAPPASGRLAARLAALVLALALALWALEYRASFVGLSYADAADYAQLGREILRGHGFRSQQAFPYGLGWLEAHDRPVEPPWPNLGRFPLPTLTRAASFLWLGPGDLGAVFPGALFHAATACVVFLLGNRLFGPLAGLTAAALSAGSPTQLHYALSGLSETGAGFFIALSALALSAAGDRRRGAIGPALWLGAVLGLGWLQRSNLALLAAVALLLLCWGPERRTWRAVPALVAGFLAAASPWLARNALHFGSATLSLTADRALIRAVHGADPFRSFEQYDVWAEVAARPDALAAGLGPGWLVEHWHGMFGAELAWLGPLFLLVGVTRLGPGARSIWLYALGGLLATVALLSGIYPDVGRFYVPFAPLLLGLGVGGVFAWLRRFPRLPSWSAAALAAAVALAAIAPVLVKAVAVEPRAARGELVRRSLEERLPASGVVASDISWLVAWYGDRPAVRFFGDPATLEALDRGYVRVGAVLLSGARTERFRQALTVSALAERFQETHSFRDGTTLWVARGSSS